MKIKSLPDRFWLKVLGADEQQCWPWIGSLVNGYGSFRYDGKVKKAHRLVYEMHNGPIPKGMVVMHKCDNPACVNLAHLRLGTPRDNNIDRDNKGRHISLKGEAHGMAKNCVTGIKKIRALQKKHTIERNALAKKLGIAATTISDVMNGRTWNWLK